jgi:hypothetical protein
MDLYGTELVANSESNIKMELLVPEPLEKESESLFSTAYSLITEPISLAGE